MKKLLVYGILMIFLNFSYGQMTAPDWTLNDCSSNSHTLYTYLDSQEVVVMEFSMGCASCTNAAGYLMNLKNQYAISHPGKVNWFYMDYWPGNTCGTDVASVMATYNFDAGFANCGPQEDEYYPSASPMPAIIVAAGNFHTVLFQNLTWYNSDTALIKAAIDQFFVTVGMEDHSAEQTFIYPNPVQDKLFVNLTSLGEELQKVSVYHISGAEIRSISYRIDKNILMLQTDQLANGNYILELSGGGKTFRKVFIKN